MNDMSSRTHVGVELLRGQLADNIDTSFKLLWHHPDAIFCCIIKVGASLDLSFMHSFCDELFKIMGCHLIFKVHFFMNLLGFFINLLCYHIFEL